MFATNSVIDSLRNTGEGEVAIDIVNGEQLAGDVLHYDPGLRRPYLHRGEAWVDVTVGYKPRTDANKKLILNSGGQPIYDRVKKPQRVAERMALNLPVLHVDNASTLRKDQWIMLDAAVLSAARARLRAWSDLRAANTFGGFDGMATSILEHEIMTDPGEALVDMDGINEGRNFQPRFALQGLPLPITHSDFWLSQRMLATSRSKGQPQDTIRGEIAGRRVAEMIEQTLIGSVTGMTYGTSTDYLTTSKVYGYTNHPDRITKTNLTPSASFVGETFVNEVLAMRELAYAKNFFGPFILYVSTNYDAKLDQDYTVGTAAQGLASPSGTVRQRVRQIDGITDVRRLDYLTGDVLLLVQMTPDVVQAVNGMEITTVQWDSKGGMQRNFKVMAIQVPRIRSTYLSGGTTLVTGIVHGTTS